jgi:hypothetical protein
MNSTRVSKRNAGRAEGSVEFAYVPNFYSNNVSAYAIEASNGIPGRR